MGNFGVVLFPVLEGGEIKKISGLDRYRSHPNVISFLTRYEEGDEIGWTYDVNQRYAEVDLMGKDISEVKELIDSFYDEVEIISVKGSNMLSFDRFHVDRFIV